MTAPIESQAGLSAPARRALTGAGYTTLDDLAGVPTAELLSLHGVGPAAVTALQTAMSEAGLELGHAGHASVRPGRSGRAEAGTAGPTTAPTDVDPRTYVAGLDQQRRVDEGLLLIDLLDELTGTAARMWGPSMIGWGEQQYTYATGWGGDMFVIGFSPRKAALSLYGVAGNGYDPRPEDAELLARMGKHRTGASCVYVNKLPDIEIDILTELWRRTWKEAHHQ